MRGAEQQESTDARRWQFSLRTLVVWITLLCVVAAVGAWKVGQDRRRANALYELQRRGFQVTIGTSAGRPATWLEYTKPQFADRDLESTSACLEVLSQGHDLFRPGLEIKRLDFTSCRMSRRAAAEFEARFPEADFRH